MESIKLTQYAPGAGCGCKIAPALLQQILQSDVQQPIYDRLLVGNGANDDAAVYDMGNGMALISTTDFFTPVVDDAFDFGRVAAANAISDVYAMGGKPIMAVAILGFPVEKLPVAVAARILDGARTVCNEAGIPLAGGHSIATTEPVFGLAVNGFCEISHLKRNDTAQAGDLLFLTKPIGTGILATAGKRDKLTEEHRQILTTQMTQLNKIGEHLGRLQAITAMTDVTGFGLAGHLLEMTEGCDCSAELIYSNIHSLAGTKQYLAEKMIPDATYRNWNSYGKKIHFEMGVDVMEAFSLLPDPQTNGGLLIAVKPNGVGEVVALLEQYGLGAFITPIGSIVAKQNFSIFVKP